MPLPLARFKVLDLTRVRSGPTCVRQFADWGADVLMIENPVEGGGVAMGRASSDFQNLHRGKRSMTLDLKTEDGREILKRLAVGADVLVENFRPDVKRRLGIDYDAMAAINPRIVYASISGFGEDGPYAERPGLDQIAQGLGGMMSVTGIPGQGPVRAGIAVADSAAGLYCTIGIMTALLEREVTGKGRWVRTSLLQAQIAMLDFQAARFLVDGVVAPQEGNHHPTAVPMGCFESADGYVNLAAAGRDMFGKFCALVGREDWLSDARFCDDRARYKNRAALRAEIAAVMKARPTAEWVTLCNDAGLPCGPVHDIGAMFDDPQVQHLKMAAPVDGGETLLVAQPFTFADHDFALGAPAPGLGAQTDAVLQTLGYDAAAIADLRQRKIV